MCHMLHYDIIDIKSSKSTRRMYMIFLYPCDYFDHVQADDLFDAEKEAALHMQQGVVLFDFDAGNVVYENVPPDAGQGVMYRGWQVPCERYATELYPLMGRYGSPLVSPDAYADASLAARYMRYVGDHMLPCISMPYDEIDEKALQDVFFELGTDKVFVKDDMKSVLGHTVIDKYGTIGERAAVLSAIREQRGQDFTDSIVFKPWAPISNQVRVFVWNGEPILFAPHDGEWNGEHPSHVPCNVPSPFYVIDMGQTDDGTWIVVECGDGQVSDIGTTAEMESLYAEIVQGKQDYSASR